LRDVSREESLYYYMEVPAEDSTQGQDIFQDYDSLSGPASVVFFVEITGNCPTVFPMFHDSVMGSWAIHRTDC